VSDGIFFNAMTHCKRTTERWWIWGLVGCAIVPWCQLCFVVPAPAETMPEQAYNVKAGFIYNFSIFTEWPEKAFDSPTAPITVYVKKNTAARDAFDVLKNKKIKSRGFVIKEFDNVNEILPSCHILYIDTSDKKTVEEILRKSRDGTILTVGDMEGFARMGGIINFYTENNKLRFEINVKAAKRAQLKLSSHLLKLARIIEED